MDGLGIGVAERARLGLVLGQVARLPVGAPAMQPGSSLARREGERGPSTITRVIPAAHTSRRRQARRAAFRVACVNLGVLQWLESWNPHAVAARANAGDCKSIVRGNTRITPSRSAISWMAVRLNGMDVLGSGKL